MTANYVEQLPESYQVPDDAAPAPFEEVEADLIDFSTGVGLIDPTTQTSLTGSTIEQQLLSSSGGFTPITINTDRTTLIDVTNREQSEVELNLLGVQRAETQLGLLESVNVYGVNTKEWADGPRGSQEYTYFTDPSDWTNQGSYGVFQRHLREESALQAYCFPPPTSFVYPAGDSSEFGTGGFTNGVMNAFWQTKRTFRYQPGRATGFTFGVRMSTNSNYAGEKVEWGCRNDYGDGYFYRLSQGINLSIVYKRFNPTQGIVEEIVIPRDEWNGDQISLDQTSTGWILDLSKVTMFKIEFSWYGAVGAKFMAFVPVDNGEARWVKLHYITIENSLLFPSLRSAFMRMFINARNTAGATSPAFINLYGSSAYIDGGDKGTVTVGTASLQDFKAVDTASRSILGLQVKGTINDVQNQKAVYPIALTAYASVPARLDLVFQSNSLNASEHYFYGNGTNLSRGASSAIAVTRTTPTTLTGSFPSLSEELVGTTNYLTGRRVRVTGSGIFDTHVVTATPTEITTNRSIPSGTTSIRLSRLNAHALVSNVVPSGATDGSVFFNSGGGQWRIGLWLNASGQPYTNSANVAWIASKYTALTYNSLQQVTGERFLPFEPYRQVDFAIVFPSGTSDTQFNISSTNYSASYTLSGSTNPWPIALVAELMDSSQVNDVVVAIGSRETLLVPGSGTTTAISGWTTLNGVSESSVDAGGANYIANKFQASISDPLSAVLVDTQGYRTLRSPQSVATYFIGSGQTKQFDLGPLFGPDKMFITGAPSTENNTGALFVVATSRSGTGVVGATLSWEEQ